MFNIFYSYIHISNRTNDINAEQAKEISSGLKELKQLTTLNLNL
jgi:hypothetical protein